MEIIIPAAGVSSRFPNMKPKYLLYDYNGISMLHQSLSPFLDKFKITVGILKEHFDKFEVKDFLQHEFGNSVNFVIIPELTAGPADTIYQMLHLDNRINPQNSILIKDCDSFFDHDILDGSYICVEKAENVKKPNILTNKSFVISNEHDIVQKIVEKQIVSDTFCVGGYKFETGRDFINSFDQIKKYTIKEIFVSHVIENLILNGKIFKTNFVKNLVDVGTLTDWIEYNNKPTIFCDIDGTLIESQQRYGKNSYDSPIKILKNNINKILEMQAQGCQIIFTTARPENSRKITEKNLDELGFKNYQLIMNLNNASRILINDYNNSNPYPRAVAINIKRNSDVLNELL